MDLDEGVPAYLWHAPRPGPDYWSWRCLECDAPVNTHPSWWRRTRRRWRIRRQA